MTFWYSSISQQYHLLKIEINLQLYKIIYKFIKSKYWLIQETWE